MKRYLVFDYNHKRSFQIIFPLVIVLINLQFNLNFINGINILILLGENDKAYRISFLISNEGGSIDYIFSERLKLDFL